MPPTYTGSFITDTTRKQVGYLPYVTETKVHNGIRFLICDGQVFEVSFPNQSTAYAAPAK
jgi:hypothetical protein